MLDPDVVAVVVVVWNGAEVARWPLTAPSRPDLSVVETVARLQLAARRLGCSITLRQASPALAELLQLAGLTEADSPEYALAVEVGGQAEEGEEVGVEEVVVPDDPVA